jgi:hypothetical protein
VKAIVALMEQPGSRAATSAEANEKVHMLCLRDVGCVLLCFACMQAAHCFSHTTASCNQKLAAVAPFCCTCIPVAQVRARRKPSHIISMIQHFRFARTTVSRLTE